MKVKKISLEQKVNNVANLSNQAFGATLALCKRVDELEDKVVTLTVGLILLSVSFWLLTREPRA